MGFKGQPKTKEQMKAQDAARAARKAGNPLPKVELIPEDLEPQPEDGLVEKIKKKRKRRKAKKAQAEKSIEEPVEEEEVAD